MDWIRRLIVLSLMCLLVPAAGFSATEGSEGGQSGEHGQGGGGCGDTFGDLVHIKRDAATGQPILQQRWIEYPITGEAWGYCPIPLDANGNEIPFLELSCDPDPAYTPVEVDYFGRLSGGRTKERNSRMHFDEVISTIKMADLVTVEETGRLKFGFDCDTRGQCAEWSTVDSPMENLALYSRLMRYGHLQTDPLEEDTWAHGDPALGIQYHVALDPDTDWDKFAPEVQHLLPASVHYGTEDLENEDFIRAGILLGSAANKTGKITVDLVQYMNRILKITQETPASLANQNLLPALIRTIEGAIIPADEFDFGVLVPPAPADEMFIDFSAVRYDRGSWFNKRVEVIRPISSYTPKNWIVDGTVRLMDWLQAANGSYDPNSPVTKVSGFVDAASDGLRSVEFIHNYEVPATLWNFQTSSWQNWNTWTR